jgi:hypothetical protein
MEFCSYKNEMAYTKERKKQREQHQVLWAQLVWCELWQYRLWSFKSRAKKLEIFLPKNGIFQWKKIKNDSDDFWHGLKTLREEIVFTERPKIHSYSQSFRYGQSIFCLTNRPNFSDIFDLCLHWVSVVCDFWHRKLTLKVIFWHFLTPPLYTNSQNLIISFGYVDFVSSDSITGIAKMWAQYTDKYTLRVASWKMKTWRE